MFKIKVKDMEWSIKLLTDVDYVKQLEDDSLGMTDRDELTVYFRESALSQRIIIHELMHVYVASCCIHSVPELTHEQMEELCAEIVEYHIHDILRKSSQILKKLKKIKA